MGILKIPDVVVISPGGVATTALISHLEKYVSVNHPHDFDGLKHLSLPKANWRRTRVIFIKATGPEVEKVIESLFNRKIDRAQILKLGGSICDTLLPERKRWLILRQLISNQREAFASTSSNQLTVSSELLHKAAPEIARFLEITDERFPAEYPIDSRRAVT